VTASTFIPPVSFQLPDPTTGWRWSPGYRTRRVREGDEGTFGQWVVQRWNGDGWEHTGYAPSYGGARDLATADQRERAAARRASA
jgi:hypothetical protein